MAELTYVSDGSDLLVTLLNIKRSKYWPLAKRIWSKSEDRDDIVGDMLIIAKAEFLEDVNREETAWDSDADAKLKARKAIVDKVGIEIISAAELARITFNEASYTRILDRAEKNVRLAVLNLKIQRSPYNIVNVQPQMLDPDSDYSTDIVDG